MKAALAPMLAAALFSSAAMALDDAHMCRNGLFPEEGTAYSLARISGEGRAFLIEDDVFCEKGKTCPVCPKDAAACQSRSFLLSGDLVVAGKSFDGFRCIFYRDQKNVAGSAGYVPEGRLETLPQPNVTQKDWPGEWRMGDDFIMLRAKGAKLSASGEAYWPSANPSPKEVPGGPHTGEMSGLAEPKGDKVAFADGEDECHVSLTLLPPFLLARDNDRCGGANVRFNGVYLRAPGKKR
ncbi:MAG: hypothetical protein CTY15_00045 [Methylocystis sp.]|nr:MAG: hypothetical protein CTY15_00045 [Methylocystis sp.]